VESNKSLSDIPVQTDI